MKAYGRKSPLLRAIESVMETKGLRLIILMRLSLLIPFNISNFVFGGSSVKYFDFIIGTLGLFPIVLFFVYIGTTMSSI